MLFNPENVKNIPQEMKERTCWINWRFKPVPGKKPTKVPVNPHTGGNASTKDPQTWGDFETALAAAKARPEKLGLGFVFEKPFVGVDLDHCVKEGTLSDYAAEVLGKFRGTYAETSPSGDGVHIICLGEIGKASKTDLREIYTERRFFTVTGEKLSECPTIVARCSDDAQDWLAKETQGKASEGSSLPDIDEDEDDPPDALLWDALRDTNDQFLATWDKKRKFGSDSEYDMALARMAVNAGWEDQDIYRLLVAWRKKHGSTKHRGALQSTIAKAHVAFEEGEKDKLLDSPEKLERAAVLERIQTMLGLSVVRFVQMGKANAEYRLHLKDGQVLNLATNIVMQSLKSWQTIVSEQTGAPFEASPKRWAKIRRLLHAALEYESNAETSEAAETQSWIRHYTLNTALESVDYERIKHGTAFEEGGVMHINLEKFLYHVQVNFKNSMTRHSLANRLRILDWEQTEIRRTDDDTKKTMRTRYWMHTVE